MNKWMAQSNTIFKCHSTWANQGQQSTQQRGEKEGGGLMGEAWEILINNLGWRNTLGGLTCQVWGGPILRAIKGSSKQNISLV
jgi:hypothetical protein